MGCKTNLNRCRAIRTDISAQHEKNTPQKLHLSSCRDSPAMALLARPKDEVWDVENREAWQVSVPGVHASKRSATKEEMQQFA